ncbi:hypothetical protein [Streptomyces pini]|uniref:Uncharacterized protein n=1 Tax=Streptomyces pini TaxID=1520580 RepID=A0A1I4L2C7_9ACTN|nr:hypothetical protein [Streptomyces pini]SFL85036.1 hypothetical protein SAMN05192584_12932 [Streptomyces pini]
MHKRLLRRVWAGVLGGVLLAVSQTAPAAAAPEQLPVRARAGAPAWAGTQHGTLDSRVLEIHSTADGMSAPSTATPGPTTFRTTTTQDFTGWVGLARPHEGVPWEELRAAIGKVISTDPEAIISGSGELEAAGTLLGGTVVYPDLPASFTQILRPGTYFLFDYHHVNSPEPRVQRLVVSGAFSGRVPSASATLTATMDGGEPRFTVSGTVRAGRPILFRNHMPARQLAEAVVFPLEEGVTEEDLVAWFDQFGDHGRFPDDPGPLGNGPGALPLSPGHSQVVELPLEPGPHVVINWFKDAEDGVMFLKKGQYKIFEVR